LVSAIAREYEHFLELLEALRERYGVEVHAYALMGNHYHLLIRTPRANASAALQWLNVSYSAWFNRRRERVGHVFQGRFASVLLDGQGSWALNASVYIHLNPLRTVGQGLGKAAHRAEAAGWRAPSREQVKARLRALRDFRWSSFRGYAGYSAAPGWLERAELLRRAGGPARYRRYVHEHVTRGTPPEGYEDFKGRLALGTRAFVERAKTWVGRVTGEQPARHQLTRCVALSAIVQVVERRKGEPWAQFADRYGDWGRDLGLYLARRRSGLTLRQIGGALGGLDYKAVSRAVHRFESALPRRREIRQAVHHCLSEMTKVET
jgi:REP element-mobilizing transposase RayT